MKSTELKSNFDPIQWLLEGDVSIQYQVYRDLLSEDCKEVQARIQTEGWGKRILDLQKPDGHWGRSFYQPKWTSTHYTLQDLRNLCLPPGCLQVKQVISKILVKERGRDGGINPSGSVSQSDVCINGMFLNFACYFQTDEEDLHTVVDYILEQRMPDGGFNCRLNRSGAVHSSLHSTISVAEGIREYAMNEYSYRLDELLEAEERCVEFMLLHCLYMSDHTGEVIHPAFLSFAYPFRWRYDVLRALDYLRLKSMKRDPRLVQALDHLRKKRRKDGTWSCSKHPGRIHFEMDPTRQPSRWNTLRAMRVLRHFENR